MEKQYQVVAWYDDHVVILETGDNLSCDRQAADVKTLHVPSPSGNSPDGHLGMDL